MKIEDDIVTALLQCDVPSNVTLYISGQNAPEPPAPYLMITIIDTWNLTTSSKCFERVNGVLKEGIFITKEDNISLTMISKPNDSAQDWLRKFQTGVESDMVDWAFTQSGLSLVNSSDRILYQSLPISNQNYKSATYDLVVRYQEFETYKVNEVNELGITGKLSSDIDNFQLEINFED